MAVSTSETILYLGAFLFCVGLTVVLTRRNLIMMLIGIELMLNAANLNLVGFSKLYPSNNDGQFFILFIIVVAVCEAAVGIALVLRVYHFYRTSLPDEISDLKEKY
ncbi:MAG TPA: NADH-quinone oxidoreductase subunit NuoK [Cyclobacteriaceae bacterium]|nr:NADH-quinone oxidoreductase subunit NuoK [Cyclobacteriaceae bacterium]